MLDIVNLLPINEEGLFSPKQRRGQEASFSSMGYISVRGAKAVRQAKLQKELVLIKLKTR